MAVQTSPRSPEAGRLLARAPVAVAGLTGTATAYVWWQDPARSARYPACPFHAATGWWCPFCGGLRGVHALTHGQVATALASNALLVIVGPLAAVAWTAWLLDTRGRPALRRHVAALPWTAMVAGAVVFAVLRNLPGPTHALAP